MKDTDASLLERSYLCGRRTTCDITRTRRVRLSGFSWRNFDWDKFTRKQNCSSAYVTYMYRYGRYADEVLTAALVVCNDQLKTWRSRVDRLTDSLSHSEWLTRVGLEDARPRTIILYIMHVHYIIYIYIIFCFCVGRCETSHPATWLLRRVLPTCNTTQAVKATRRQISVSRKPVVSRRTFETSQTP